VVTVAFRTTPRDQHRWQQQAHRALGVMLEHGYREGLPALMWTIAPTGALVGDVDTLTSTPEEQRAAFAAWVEYLGGDRWPERTDSSGCVRLHASFTWHQDDRVKGAIRADIWPAEDGAS
jgi:hypothetical protein